MIRGPINKKGSIFFIFFILNSFFSFFNPLASASGTAVSNNVALIIISRKPNAISWLRRQQGPLEEHDVIRLIFGFGGGEGVGGWTAGKNCEALY